MMPVQCRSPIRFLPIWVALSLVGCGGSTDEIREWIDAQGNSVKPRVESIAAPIKFVPKSYEPAGAAEPFGSAKLIAANRQDSAKASALVDAELRRRREPLEAFPLDAIAMVGSLHRDGQRFALLRAEQLLYYVKVGDYLGQNFGKITTISETEVALREVVEDASGEWTERMTTLHIK